MRTRPPVDRKAGFVLDASNRYAARLCLAAGRRRIIRLEVCYPVLNLGEPPAYREWRAPAQLQRYVACTYTSHRGVGSTRSAEPILPDGCVDIIWDGERLILAGPDTRPVRSPPTGPPVIGVRFRPGVGSLFVGVPGEELRDQRLDLRLVWPWSDQLAERLSACSDQRACAETLSAAVTRRLSDLRPVDPLVEAAVHAWAGHDAWLSTADLADRAGMTPRQVHRRFLSAVGYGPKLLQRVLRFQAFLSACADRRAALAELAFRSGYADQAHLNRDARLLAGMTPRELRAARQHVRNVQETRAAEGVHPTYATATGQHSAA